MKFKINTPPQKAIHFLISKDDLLIEKLYKVFPDGSFSELDQINLRVDNVLTHPLRIQVNGDTEWSLTIDMKYGVLFENEENLSMFLEELFFVMEDLNGVPTNLRTSIQKKEILNLKEELKELEIKNGEKFDDSKAVKKQDNKG